VHSGIPFKPLHFALCLYNSNATATILDSVVHGHARTSVSGGAIAITPVCAKRGHTMSIATFSGAGYSAGWVCDKCKKRSKHSPAMGSHRWFCDPCKGDYCFECYPALAQAVDAAVVKAELGAATSAPASDATKAKLAADTAMLLEAQEAMKVSHANELAARAADAAAVECQLLGATEELSNLHLVQTELHSNLETVMSRETALRDNASTIKAELDVAQTVVARSTATLTANLMKARLARVDASPFGGTMAMATSADAEFDELNRVEPVLADACLELLAAAKAPETLQFDALELDEALTIVDGCEADLDQKQSAIRDCGSAEATEGLLEVRDAARIAYVDAVRMLQAQLESTNMDQLRARAKAAKDAMFPLASSIPSGIDRLNPFASGMPDTSEFPEGWIEQAVADGEPLVTMVARAAGAVRRWCSRLGGHASVKSDRTESAAADVGAAMATIVPMFLDPTCTTTPHGLSTALSTLQTASGLLQDALQNEMSESSDDTIVNDFPGVIVAEVLQHIPLVAMASQERLSSLEKAAVHHRVLMESVLPYTLPDGKKMLLDVAKKAHAAKRDCKREMKVTMSKIEYAKDLSDDEDDYDEEEIEELQAQLITVKKQHRAATKADEAAQASLARAFRDHFPEMFYTHKNVADLTRRLNFGEIPIHDSTSPYELGDVILGGSHEVRKAKIDGNKVVLKKYWLTDAGSRKVFTKEVGILTRLRHPNIAQASGLVYDMKVAEAYLEMPYYGGGSLRDWFEADPMNRAEPELQQILSDLLRALEYMHANGVIHLDIKPDNILMSVDGQLKITDFDVSKDAVARTVAIRTTTSAAGQGMTLGYAAPEVLSGEPDAAAPAADLFSTGALFFWMSFYPAELTVVTATDPVAEIPDSCESHRRGFMEALFAEAPADRPSAAEALAHPYLHANSQRSLAEREREVRCWSCTDNEIPACECSWIPRPVDYYEGSGRVIRLTPHLVVPLVLPPPTYILPYY
jgi:hypothetical protein